MKFLEFGALLLGMLSWLVPNHYPPWTSFHGEALMFGAFLLWGASQVRQVPFMSVPPGVWGVVVVLLIVAWGPWKSEVLTYRGEYVGALLYLGGFGLAWTWGSRVGAQAKTAGNRMVWAGFGLSVAALLSTYIAALQWLNVEGSIGAMAVERGEGQRVVGNLAQPNLLGTFLLMGLVSTYGLYRFKRLGAGVFALLAIFLNAGIILSESRAALLSVACILIYWLVAEWRAGRQPPWTLALMWLLALWGLRSLHAAFGSVAGLDPPRDLQFGTDTVRVILWRQIVEGILQAPWGGYGWNASMAAQRVGAEVWPGSTPTGYAHNVLLDALAWFGLPIGLLLIAVLTWYLARIVWRARHPLDVILVAFSVPLLVHSQLEFPFTYAFFLFPVAWVWGVLSVRLFRIPVHQAPPLLIRNRLGQVFFGLVFLIWSSLAVRVALEYVDVEDANRVMRFEMRQLGSRPAEFVDPDLRLLDQFDAMLKWGRFEPHRGMDAGTLHQLKIANLYFNWGALHLKYIVALSLNGQSNEALHQLTVMGKVYGRATYELGLKALQGMAADRHPELNEVLRRAPPPEGFYDNRIPAPEPALKPPQSRPTSLPASPAGARP